MENICEILHYGLKHIILTCQLTVLSTRPQRFVIVTTIRFPFPVTIFWIDVPHKSGLHMISGTSLHLQKLMYFPQVRLVSQQAVSLIQCFFLPVFYLDFCWLASQNTKFPFPFTCATEPFIFYILGFGYIVLYML